MSDQANLRADANGAAEQETQPDTVKKPVSGSTSANAEHIIRHLNEYLSIRFDHAGRIHPHLINIKDDLIYHEIANVRKCLLHEKIYGIHKQAVADVFMGDNDKRRANLLSPTDQTSIQVELVSHCQDEKVETTRGQIRIHDIKTYYASIDPRLSDFMDLIETWIWWDLLDAAELSRFEQKIGLIKAVCDHKITNKMQMRYNRLIHPPEIGEDGEEKTVQQKQARPEEILRYEIAMLDHIIDKWEYRRTYELGHMFVLKRDELPRPDQGEMIHKISAEIREIDRIKDSGELSRDDQHKYAPSLGLAPENVDKEKVIQYLNHQLLESEREMLQDADRETQLGPPYNYKDTQKERMKKWLGDLHRQLDAYLAKFGPAKPVAPAEEAAAEPESQPEPQKMEPQHAHASTGENSHSSSGEMPVSFEDDPIAKAQKKAEGGGDAASMWEDILNDEQ